MKPASLVLAGIAARVGCAGSDRAAREPAAEQRGESVEPPLPSQPALLSQESLEVLSYLRPVFG
jgi:hypothetical protein